MPGAGFGAFGPKKCVCVSTIPVWCAACMVQIMNKQAATATRRASNDTPGIRLLKNTAAAATAAIQEATSIKSDTPLCSCTAAAVDSPT